MSDEKTRGRIFGLWVKLCALCVSVVNDVSKWLTAETPSTPRWRREFTTLFEARLDPPSRASYNELSLQNQRTVFYQKETEVW